MSSESTINQFLDALEELYTDVDPDESRKAFKKTVFSVLFPRYEEILRSEFYDRLCRMLLNVPGLNNAFLRARMKREREVDGADKDGDQDNKRARTEEEYLPFGKPSYVP